MFKTKFIGWDDVIGVDFTRTAQSVQRTGADLQKWAKQQETKVKIELLQWYRIIIESEKKIFS